MRTFRYVVTAVSIAMSAGWVYPAGAEEQPTSPVAPATSAVEACNLFRDALKPRAQRGTQAPPNHAQQSFGDIASAGKQGITCAQALAKYFQDLRKNGAKGSWSDIEKEMDLVIDTYRSLLERIEGTDGAYEEGRRAVTVLDAQIKDMAARRGEKNQNVLAAEKIRDKIAGELDKTKNLKATLDNVLVEMQSRKSEIVEAEGIQRYSIAEKALEDMNAGLAKVIDELVKAVQKPGS